MLEAAEKDRHKHVSLKVALNQVPWTRNRSFRESLLHAAQHGFEHMPSHQCARQESHWCGNAHSATCENGFKACAKDIGTCETGTVGMVRHWMAPVNETVLSTLYEREEFSDAAPEAEFIGRRSRIPAAAFDGGVTVEGPFMDALKGILARKTWVAYVVNHGTFVSSTIHVFDIGCSQRVSDIVGSPFVHPSCFLLHPRQHNDMRPQLGRGGTVGGAGFSRLLWLSVLPGERQASL